MRTYLLEAALLGRAATASAGAEWARGAEWVRGAQVTVSDDGFITRIEHPAPDGAPAAGAPAAGAPAAENPPDSPPERVRGIVLPGMPNAHSHAFQRAMAGRAEFRLSAKDSFWTWRRAMYALANRIEPAQLQLIATQLFVEMLAAGYTAVAEFHYLHRAQGGTAYANDNPLWGAVSAAARDAGIGLTLLPTLYQTSDFGAQPLKEEQRRFRMETAEFLEAVARRVADERDAAKRTSAPQRTGAAFHSLRAVPLPSIHEAVRGLGLIDPDMPVHIHVAEQQQEVRSCVLATGSRPIERLLQEDLVGPHWCLVHATHATPAELQGIADARATVCVSISTEANLGDGHFDAARFLRGGGRLCIGSDSQSTVSPAEELRWLEYQQRLRRKRRAVLATRGEPHVGTRLWQDAAFAGAQALGQPIGALAVGLRADWLVLDADHPTLAGAGPAGALDHLLFAGGESAIRDVMVAGRWVIRDRRHIAGELLADRFAALMRSLQE